MSDTEIDNNTPADPAFAAFDAADEPSEEQVVAVLDRISRSNNVPMPLEARTPWRPVARLDAVQPEGHSRYGTECRKAWQTYLGVVQTWADARNAVDEIPGEQADEKAEAKRVMLGQERDGKPLKAPKPRDWETEQATREVRRDIAFERGHAAKKAYNELVSANAGRWVAEAVAAVQPARIEAVKAVAALAADIETWLRARDAAIELSTVADPSLSDYYVMARDDAATLRAGRAALPALRALLASEHPVVSGTFVTEAASDPVQPPVYVREFFNEDTNLGALLGQIELNEDYKVTRLAYDWRQRLTPGQPVQWRRSRL